MSTKRHTNRSVSKFVGVESVPQSVQRLSQFDLLDDRLNYVDCFVLAVPGADARSPEAWARAILERNDASRALWTLMGLQLGPPHSIDHVQGWTIERRTEKWLRLETSSWYMKANAVVLIEGGQVSVSLSLSFTSPIAGVVWAPISRLHQYALPGMLRAAAKVVAETTGVAGHSNINGAPLGSDL